MKKSLNPWRAAVVAVLAAVVAAGPALADKDDAPGQQRKREAAPSTQATAAPSGSTRSQVSISIGAVFGDRDRATVQAYYGDRYAQAQRCPPGLAKKNNGCQPPGQAKKYTVGQPLPAAASLRQRIAAFQAAEGLPADGMAGPRTLMHLNRATGVDEPRLSAVNPNERR